MPRTKKPLSDKQWLNQEPDAMEVELTPTGGKHIPIEKLRPLLDRLNSCVTNYKTIVYKDQYSVLCAHGSLELTVTIDGKERTVIGAYNLNIADAPSGFWNGTLKSECVKNGAMELGKRFGRELNKDTPKAEPQQVIKVKAKPQADSKIMKQFEAAVLRGDEAAITTLKSIYEIPKQN